MQNKNQWLFNVLTTSKPQLFDFLCLLHILYPLSRTLSLSIEWIRFTRTVSPNVLSQYLLKIKQTQDIRDPVLELHISNICYGTNLWNLAILTFALFACARGERHNLPPQMCCLLARPEWRYFNQANSLLLFLKYYSYNIDGIALPCRYKIISTWIDG